MKNTIILMALVISSLFLLTACSASEKKSSVVRPDEIELVKDAISDYIAKYDTKITKVYKAKITEQNVYETDDGKITFSVVEIEASFEGDRHKCVYYVYVAELFYENSKELKLVHYESKGKVTYVGDEGQEEIYQVVKAKCVKLVREMTELKTIREHLLNVLY